MRPRRLVGLAIGAFLGLGARVNASPAIRPSFLSYDTAPVPGALAAQDLNRDGTQDVVAVSHDGNVVSVFAGAGDGTLRPRVDYPVALRPSAVAIGDLDGDGWPDLAVASNETGVLTLLFGSATGFTGSQQLMCPGHPKDIALADLDGDGQLDIITSTYQSLTLFMGRGAAAWDTVTVPLAIDPGWIAVGDLNDDGLPDIVAATSATQIAVMLGRGDGSFTLMPTLDIGFYEPISRVRLADLNRDGHLDVTCACGGYYGVVTFPGVGDGTFGHWIAAAEYTTSATDMAIADFDGDRMPDWALSLSARAAVVYGDGHALDAALAFGQTAESSGPIVAVDLNGDGKPDLVTGNGSTLSVLLNQGGRPSFYTCPTTHIDLSGDTGAIASADLDGDKRADLIVASTQPIGAAVLLGNGDGTFRFGEWLFTSGIPYGLALADLNGDGKIDLVMPSAATSTVSIRLGNGNGTFSSPTDYACGASPYGVAVGDLNGDGIPDLAVANRNSNSVSILLGIGGGAFAPARNVATGAYPQWIAIGDLDGDRALDVLTSNLNSEAPSNPAGTVSVLRGHGDGSFEPHSDYLTIRQAADLKLAWLGPDSALDVVVVGTADNVVAVLRGRGDGTLAPPITFPTGRHPAAVVVVDLNGDGVDDLVTANSDPLLIGNQVYPGTNTISMLLGNGDGTYQPSIQYGVNRDPDGLCIADVSGHGTPDIVTMDHFINSVSTVRNLEAVLMLTTTSGHGRVAAGPSQPYYDPGTAVTVTALADSGWGFADWTSAAAGAGNPLQLHMDRDTSFTASFVDIAPPTVHVLAPNGAEAYTIGDWLAIRWTATDNASPPTTVDISLSLDAGITFAPIAQGAPNTGSYLWAASEPTNVGVVPVYSAKIQVAAHDASNHWASDTSDSCFSIFSWTAASVDSLPRASGLIIDGGNPAHGRVRLTLDLRNDTAVRLSILDVTGREIEVLAKGTLSAGRHAMSWSPSVRRPSPTGVYWARCAMGGRVTTRPFVLLN